MDFSASSFYLKHNSVFFWAAIWLLLFIYWHVCAIKIYFEMKDNKSKRTLVLYLLTIADASFILSAIYVLFGYFFFSVNVCTDSPSIWCTFYVLQSFLVPFLFFKLFKFLVYNMGRWRNLVSCPLGYQKPSRGRLRVQIPTGP